MKIPILAICLLLFSGCSLFPKSVEYFQRKVKAVPQPQPALIEVQKQAAAYVDLKITEAKVAAAATSADASVQTPISEAATVSRPLSTSLGPPLTPWSQPATNLAVKVDHETATLDRAVSKYADKVKQDEGKKIEGSGLFKIGFFTQWALVLGVVALGWGAFRVYGLINPVAGLAGNVVGRVSSKVFHTGFHQLVEGGEKFKEFVKSAVTLSDTQKHEISALFNQAHERTQDRGVQELVAKLTA